VALLRPRADWHAGRHPEPVDVFLLVEVASSSASFDRLVNLSLYARAGVPQAWLVDLEAGAVEVYRAARGGRYAEAEIVTGDGRLVVDALPDITLTAADVLG
jgi:Uma2 family endonuclease